MSRYLILLILTAPFVFAALLNLLVTYKLKKISRRRYMTQSLLWLIILAGIALANPIYRFLFSNNLTTTEPLSLFDVIQITGIVVVLFIANRSRAKIEILERRVQDLHQELSIQLSTKSKNSKD